LQLVGQAVDAEEKYLVGMLGQDMRDREIGTWAEGVATHYERKRRAEILESARKLILMEGGEDWIRVDLHVPAEIHDAPKQDKTPALFSEQPSNEEDAWGLWDEGKPETAAEKEQVDEWGFEDEELEPEVESQPEVDPTPLQPPPDPQLHANGDNEDPADAWGWNDDEDQLVPEERQNGTSSTPESTNEDSSAWNDDPWAEPSSPVGMLQPSTPPLSPPVTTPRTATGLEKLATKGRSKASHAPQENARSPVTAAPPSTPMRHPSKNQNSERPQRYTVPIKAEAKEPEKEIENYAVTARSRDVVGTVEAALRESTEFASSSSIFAHASFHPSWSSQARGAVLLQSAPFILDLFCALYPVKNTQVLEDSVVRSMVFANDCVYLGTRATKLAGKERDQNVRENLAEAAERLDVLGESWFEDTIVSTACHVNQLCLIVPSIAGTTTASNRGSSRWCRAVRRYFRPGAL